MVHLIFIICNLQRGLPRKAGNPAKRCWGPIQFGVLLAFYGCRGGYPVPHDPSLCSLILSVHVALLFCFLASGPFTVVAVSSAFRVGSAFCWNEKSILGQYPFYRRGHRMASSAWSNFSSTYINIFEHTQEKPWTFINKFFLFFFHMALHYWKGSFFIFIFCSSSKTLTLYSFIKR